MNSVFHAGETTLQSAAGSRERLAEVGPRVIREEMPEQHRAFFASLPFLVMATTDPVGQPYVGMLTGSPGFVSAPDGRHLQIAGRPAPDDPLDALLLPGARFGLLGIEAHTRRRNRANGRVLARSADGLSLGVAQSFGNCPKYIQPRRALFDPDWRAGAPAEERADLVVTGEGRTDGQTVYGKAPIGVARVAARCGVPVIALSGCLTPDSAAVHEHGIAAVFSAVRRPCTVEEALRDAAVNVRSAAYNVASALSLGMRIEASRRARPGIQATDTRLPARP